MLPPSGERSPGSMGRGSSVSFRRAKRRAGDRSKNKKEKDRSLSL